MRVTYGQEEEGPCKLQIEGEEGVRSKSKASDDRPERSHLMCPSQFFVGDQPADLFYSMYNMSDCMGASLVYIYLATFPFALG